MGYAVPRGFFGDDKMHRMVLRAIARLSCIIYVFILLQHLNNVIVGFYNKENIANLFYSIC